MIKVSTIHYNPTSTERLIPVRLTSTGKHHARPDPSVHDVVGQPQSEERGTNEFTIHRVENSSDTPRGTNRLQVHTKLQYH